MKVWRPRRAMWADDADDDPRVLFTRGGSRPSSLEARASHLDVWSDVPFHHEEPHPVDDWEETQAHHLHKPWMLLSIPQRLVLGLAAVALIAAAVRWPMPTAVVVNSAVVIFFLVANAFKLLVVRAATRHPAAVRVSQADASRTPDDELPVYTILLPMYHEAALVPQMVDGLARLDYPASRLDIKVLLEEDDFETRSAVAAAHLPEHYEVLTIPDLGPRGKPRACNTGLARARGTYLVIFDAEDRPDPDQLRKVVAAFRRASPETVCLQAKLNYFNRAHNLLTRWFTAEYSVWFDQLLPGLQAMDVPIPLGGTSNHFVISALRQIGGWNAFNVTEDADLGVRVFIHGWRTAVIDSTTYEEATSRYGNWIRQRSRWVKGYMQTYLYHMRHPLKMYRHMGLGAFVAFQLFVGGNSLILLLNPVYWLMTAAWYITSSHGIQMLFPLPILYAGTAALLFGNAVFTLLALVGCLERRNYGDVKWALLAPVYWLLMSVGAWKALLQLVTRPYYWEKTEHGHCLAEAPDAGAPVILERALVGQEAS